MSNVKIYGADWCFLTHRSMDHLRHRGVPFDYINIERDPKAAEWVRSQNGGKEKKPTVDIDGTILSEPSNEELDAALA